MIKTLRTFPNNTVINRKVEDRKTKIVTIGNFLKNGIVKPSVGGRVAKKSASTRIRIVTSSRKRGILNSNAMLNLKQTRYFQSRQEIGTSSIQIVSRRFFLFFFIKQEDSHLGHFINRQPLKAGSLSTILSFFNTFSTSCL
jgi:hypothetical protein